MRDRNTDALRRKREPADAGRKIQRFWLVLTRLHEGGLAGRPCCRTVRAGCDGVDPAALGVGRYRAALALGVGRDHLAVVATGDDARAVACNGENAAAV